MEAGAWCGGEEIGIGPPQRRSSTLPAKRSQDARPSARSPDRRDQSRPPGDCLKPRQTRRMVLSVLRVFHSKRGINKIFCLWSRALWASRWFSGAYHLLCDSSCTLPIISKVEMFIHSQIVHCNALRSSLSLSALWTAVSPGLTLPCRSLLPVPYRALHSQAPGHLSEWLYPNSSVHPLRLLNLLSHT